MSESNAIVTYEVRGNVALITLNRPDARNAINGDVAKGLEDAIDRLEQEQGVWCGVITANTTGHKTPVFCAGADLKAINSGQAGDLNTTRGGFAGFVYRDRSKPVIAAVDGLATAGGCEIVLACDIVIATDRSQFGLAEVKRNLIAGAGGLFRLPRAVGRNVAMEAILTGDPLTAQRAYELGLVNHVVAADVLIGKALDVAGKVASSAPIAVAKSRRIVLASAYEDDETLKKMTDTAFGEVLKSEDTKEGLTAFIEKRQPNWQGR